ncbi:hypothetical protein JOQ06_000731, partial [Pogonophryne albipinna]
IPLQMSPSGDAEPQVQLQSIGGELNLWVMYRSNSNMMESPGKKSTKEKKKEREQGKQPHFDSQIPAPTCDADL